MTRLAKAALLAGALALFGAGATVACTLSVPAEAARRAVPAGNLDLSLLDAAVRAELNHARCRNGLPALRAAGAALTRTAAAHSRWMISARSLTHRSNVSGRRTASERIRASGIRLRAGSENVGYVSRYRIDGLRFRILDASSCSFATYGGEPLPAHSYASLAKAIVTTLMASSGHRRNILDRRVNRVATGAAFDAAGSHCGRIWFTQSFVG